MRRLPLALALLGGCDHGDGPVPADDQPPVTGTCPERDDDDDPWADCLDAIAAAAGVDFGHERLPDIVLGPPVPGPGGAGSTDVASLGCGGSITLAFDGEGIVDGPGPDLVVFENAFASPGGAFVEPAQVLVSDDGETWWAFACEPGGDARGCAGVTPVASEATHAPVDPRRSGGDGFDLADVGLAHARWVRLIDRTAEHYGDDQWCQGAAGGFDLDAMAAVEP